MSTLILSLLLLFLVAVGLLMGAKATERFENPENPELQATVIVSPALKNMMLSSVQAPAIPEQTELSREQDLQAARAAGVPAYLITPDGTKHLLGPGGVQKYILGPNGEEHWIPNFGPDGPENWPYGPEPKPKPKPSPSPGPTPNPKPHPEPTPMPPAPMPPGCPVCPTCPDMSQYIRLDEVPCWNCTLP